MEYIVTKRFKGQAICGQVNLPFGTICQVDDNFICFEGGRLCAISSQNAYNHFAQNTDGKGIERGAKIQEIINTLSKRDDHYQDRWDKIWDDPTLERFKKKHLGDDWVWNFDFYNASIEDLEYIANKIK